VITAGDACLWSVLSLLVLPRRREGCPQLGAQALHLALTGQEDEHAARRQTPVDLTHLGVRRSHSAS